MYPYCLPDQCLYAFDPARHSTQASIQTTPAVDPYLQSSGGGEPRSPGYWLIWNTCAEGNQAETAKANCGLAAGWILMDDLLADPGILVGELQVETYQQGINLLQTRFEQHHSSKFCTRYRKCQEI